MRNTDCAAHLPLVSVIIPAYNIAPRLRLVLNAVKRQDYSAGQFEVIVIDNGSGDETIRVARAVEGVTVLEESNYLQSPYSARNRGLEVARGEIVIFLDATCVPVCGWLEAGVQAILDGADLVAGDIQFELGNRPTIGRVYDSLVNVKMRESVARGVAKTGNLFVHRRVLDALGLFPEGIRSGGDVRWTGAATEAGFQLVFSESAAATYPARPLIALLRKQWRVAKGQPAIYRDRGQDMSVLKVLMTGLLPPKIRDVRRIIEKRGQPWMHRRMISLWAVRYLVRMLMALGNLYGMMYLREKV